MEGANRFATAAVGNEFPARSGTNVGDAYVVDGADADPNRGWSDAVTVGSLAAQQGRPILLVTTETLPDDTQEAISNLGVDRVTIVGGPLRCRRASPTRSTTHVQPWTASPAPPGSRRPGASRKLRNRPARIRSVCGSRQADRSPTRRVTSCSSGNSQPGIRELDDHYREGTGIALSNSTSSGPITNRWRSPSMIAAGSLS